MTCFSQQQHSWCCQSMSVATCWHITLWYCSSEYKPSWWCQSMHIATCWRVTLWYCSSEHKFDSGCGWPAYYDNLPGAVDRHVDNSYGMRRVEITCSNCGGHLGHVFEGEVCVPGWYPILKSAYCNILTCSCWHSQMKFLNACCHAKWHGKCSSFQFQSCQCMCCSWLSIFRDAWATEMVNVWHAYLYISYLSYYQETGMGFQVISHPCVIVVQSSDATCLEATNV